MVVRNDIVLEKNAAKEKQLQTNVVAIEFISVMQHYEQAECS